jgi:hypothetical protein
MTSEAGPDAQGPLDCSGGTCKRVFLSSTTTTSAILGGVAATDSMCQSLADARNLGGTWMAWLSDAQTAPGIRFAKAGVPYRLLDGTVVANDWGALTSGLLAHSIDMDEAGTTVSAAISVTEVWTGTTYLGNYAGADCRGWTSDMGHGLLYAEVGVFNVTDKAWTEAYLQFCDRGSLRLYCFEQ